jgi:CDP-diacylglycerol---glycerol-3-phosphate 3-phosphatidyltransferase
LHIALLHIALLHIALLHITSSCFMCLRACTPACVSLLSGSLKSFSLLKHNRHDGCKLSFFAPVMLTLYHCKSRFQDQLRPIVNQLARWQISPNQITLAALALSGVSGLAIALNPTAQWPLVSVPFVLLARMALNAIDGMLAREHDQTTLLGGVLNELGDVLADAWLYLPFALLPGVSPPWIVGIVMLAMVSELAGVLGLALAGKRGYEGPMGKSDRALVFAVIAIVLGLGTTSPAWLNAIWPTIIGLQIWTITNRVRGLLREATPCS